MGALKDANRDDLLNRFASHTFTETVVGDHTLVEFKNASSVVIASSTKEVVDDAYRHIRQMLVDGGSILIGDFTFQGSTKFGGLTTITPDGAIDVVGTDAPTGRIRATRYQATPNAGAALQLGHSRGSEGSLSALLAQDRLGQLLFNGDDAVSADSSGAVIRAIATENWSSTTKGTQIRFETTDDGAATFVVAFIVSQHGYPEAPDYEVASLPSAVPGGGIIYVSDETGGATLAFSDGTNWRRVQDRAIVA